MLVLFPTEWIERLRHGWAVETRQQCLSCQSFISSYESQSNLLSVFPVKMTNRRKGNYGKETN